MNELNIPRGRKTNPPTIEGMFKNINQKNRIMKVIINNEEFILSEEKCKGQNLDLKVFGFYLDLNYTKDVVHTFSSNSEGRLIAWELSNPNGNEACVPLVIGNSKITPELFFQELKEKITPYLI